MVLALEVQKVFTDAISLNVTTSTVNVSRLIQNLILNNIFVQGSSLYSSHGIMPLSYWRVLFVRTAREIKEVRSYGTAKRAARIAIVGSGPAGLFSCGSLLRRLPESKFDVFDAAPVPYGLVRYGVAPDHQEMKNCTNIFDRMFESNRDRLSLFCNVSIGSDVTVEELTKHYDAILLAYGAHRPRQLDIPGSKSTNVISGSDFVSWYNGVPNTKVSAAPLLDDPNMVIIGNGNVALDCARILSTVKMLGSTDIPSDVLAVLESSEVTNIKIVGRRGPENVSFTIKELREQFKVPDWNTTVEMDEELRKSLKESVEKMDRRRKRLMKLLLDGVGPPQGEKQCRFLSFRVPEEIIPDKEGRISAVRLLNKRTGNKEELPCGLLIYSIGYQTVVLEGLPTNEKGMIAMRDSSRVDMPCGAAVYAAGWCAHGPQGVIVDTQQEAVAVADHIVEDIMAREDISGTRRGVQSILDAKGVDYLTFDEWKKIDEEEVKKGAEKGKVREKLTKFNGFIRKHSQYNMLHLIVCVSRHFISTSVMASLESKILDGKSAGYCSSSDDEEGGWSVAKDDDQHQANVMRKMGPSTNTGAKGVLNEYAAYKEQATRVREAKDREVLRQARKGMLQGSYLEREEAQKSDRDEEESLESIRERRLLEMRKAAAGRMLEIVSKEQFTKAIDTCESLLCVLIYEPEDEMCDKMTHVCKVLAADYPRVRFMRARSTLLEMSKAFTEQALPTLQVYYNGNLVGNFIKVHSLLGGEIDVTSTRKFLRRQHINLVYGNYTTDSECSTDEDID
ncbi:hypothetical protein GCK32_002735 [Trichostrongylus colubriformis]|uniref:NADPH:adrenodoxin oxidoreductase, mitochondrial n=1 Tax=Trichostrongylus colubriformis TaxID=6319 RepID=A0AAN8IC23_TRICO